MKFNLEGDETDEELHILTHGGKSLDKIDDYEEDKIGSDDSDYENRDDRKGVLSTDHVNRMNFGTGQGGDSEEEEQTRKKTKEERNAEIMEKSKAYKLHHQEIKEATMEATKQLDEEWADVALLLNFNKKVERKEPKDLFDDILTKLKTENILKVQPQKLEVTEKQKAQARRERLEQLAKIQQAEGEGEAEDQVDNKTLNKREQKLQTKRDQLMEKTLQEQKKKEFLVSNHDKI